MGSTDEVFSNDGTTNWSNYGTDDENLTLLMPVYRAPRMERRTSSLCLPPTAMMPTSQYQPSLQGSPSLSSKMNRSTSLKYRFEEDYGECYTPTLFRRQRNPLLAKVESSPKKSSEHWQKIRKKIFFVKKISKDQEQVENGIEEHDAAGDVGFLRILRITT